MELLAVLGLLLVWSSTLTHAQPACPQGLSTVNTTISTNDVILIKAPLLKYADALSACQCFGDGWQLANQTAFLDFFHKSTTNVSQANSQAIQALLTDNFPLPAIAWFGYEDVDYSLNDCPQYEVNPSFTAQELGPCTNQQAAICARSKLVYNALGSPCDNNLQLCQRGSYCNAPAGGTGTCVVDATCYPTNPCQNGLLGGYSSNPLDAFCTVTPGAPGGYTCDCGYLQAVTVDPSPQTCLECPSANPCAVTNCPQGSSCSFNCGDRRGAICVAPNGTVVFQTRPSPSNPPTATSAPAPAPASTTTDSACYPTNPCQAGLAGGYSSNPSDAVCTVKSGAPGGYTCSCGYLQAVTIDPSPQTCLECPSANPCAVTDCPQGSSCSFNCGDRRGAICVTPNGTVVSQARPSLARPPTATAPTTTTPTGCQGNPCGVGGTCQPTATSHTCSCFIGFISNGGTCVPSPAEPYHTF